MRRSRARRLDRALHRFRIGGDGAMTDGGWMEPDEERRLDCAEDADPDQLEEELGRMRSEGWKRDPFLWGMPDE